MEDMSYYIWKDFSSIKHIQGGELGIHIHAHAKHQFE